MRCLAFVLLHVSLAVALQPAQHAPPLQKIGKGKYAHWPIATHTAAAHKITVALSIDASPARVKLKFFDASAKEDNQLVQGDANGRKLPAHILRRRVENRSSKPKIGFVLLENRDNCSHFLGMQVTEAYRGQGLAAVLVATWAALCLTAGFSARSGRIDKPILAHVLESLGFRSVGGTQVLLTDATRLRDCRLPSGHTVFIPKFSRSNPDLAEAGGSDPESGRSKEQRLVHVGAEFAAPTCDLLQNRVRGVLEREGGTLEVLASREQLVAALDGSWRGFEQ